jgi:hypothetical protein
MKTFVFLYKKTPIISDRSLVRRKSKRQRGLTTWFNDVSINSTTRQIRNSVDQSDTKHTNTLYTQNTQIIKKTAGTR